MEKAADQVHQSGRELILCGAREQPNQRMPEAGFPGHLGMQNICFSVEDVAIFLLSTNDAYLQNWPYQPLTIMLVVGFLFARSHCCALAKPSLFSEGRGPGRSAMDLRIGIIAADVLPAYQRA